MTRKRNVETHTCLEKKEKKQKNLINKHLPKKRDSTFEMLKTESELNHRVRKKGVFKYPLL